MSRKPSVLFVAHAHPDFRPGGGEWVAYYMYKAMRRSPRYEAYLLAGLDDPLSARAGRRLLRHEGDDRTQLLITTDLDPFFSSEGDLTFLEEFFLRLRPDIVHFHHYVNIGVDLISYVKALLPNVKLLFSLHDLWAICANGGLMVKTRTGQLCDRSSSAECFRCFPRRSPADFFVREQLFKLNFDLIDRFVVPSRFLKDRHVQWGLDPDRFVLLDYGFPRWPEPKRSRRDPAKPFMAAFIGQMHPHKGIDVFLRAGAEYLQRKRANHSNPPELRFVIHGSMMDSLPPEFVNQIKSHLDSGREIIHYYGSYRREELPARLAGADCVVVPSTWWENSPCVIQEAFLAGIPVVCSNVGGMAEKVTDRINGLHFMVGDHFDLLSKLLELAASPSLYDRLLAGIPPVFPDEAMAEVLQQVYDELLSLTPAPAA
jgi:glycosyltransferase involved in cell wall biosynthesis